jgi:hypothetical protein
VCCPYSNRLLVVGTSPLLVWLGDGFESAMFEGNPE